MMSRGTCPPPEPKRYSSATFFAPSLVLSELSALWEEAKGYLGDDPRLVNSNLLMGKKHGKKKQQNHGDSMGFNQPKL
jgi:hypothetical protein